MRQQTGRLAYPSPNNPEERGATFSYRPENERALPHVIPVPGLLRSPGFDGLFIFGTLALGLLTGAVAIRSPGLFPLIITLDIWLFGYHHVISTYTRLVFDTESFKRYKTLVMYLPLAVLSVVGLMGTLAGPWLLVTTYLYWQWYHYTRQSEGISKAYARKAQNKELGNIVIARLAFWSVPLAAIVNLSFRSPTSFLASPVYMFPVPVAVVTVMNWAAICLVAVWGYGQIKAALNGTFAFPYAAYMCSHFFIYYITYIYITEINYGWIIINVWHNTQYISFVWLFNTNRFKNGISSQHRFLSTLSQSRHFLLYFGTCFSISTLIYFCIRQLVGIFPVSMFAAPFIVYQTINFHHYIVDAVIWKLREKPLQVNLGLT